MIAVVVKLLLLIDASAPDPEHLAAPISDTNAMASAYRPLSRL